MRCVLLGLALSLAACGEEQPLTITRPPPDVSVEARADALDAKHAWEALGIKEPLAGAADQAWARAEEMRAAGDSVEAADAYVASAQAYHAVVQQIERAKRAAEEAAYEFAIEAQAKALALRTQLDSLRRSILERAAAATGWEKTVLTQTLKTCNEEVFSLDALMAIDTALETAKALFAGKRYDDASKSYLEAQASLRDFPKRCEMLEARLRALGHKQLAAKAAKRARVVYRTQKMPPPKAARDAFEAIKLGDAKYAGQEYDDAMAAYDDARKGYEEAFALAPTLLAARNEAAQTYRTAMLARNGWLAYASSERIDPDGPSAQAEAVMARGKAAAKKGDFTLAAREFRAARKLFDGLKATTSGVDDKLKAKQKGPAPIREGTFPTQGERRAVRLGLMWLARHQDEDGRWDCDAYMKHDPAADKCDGKGGILYDIGVSGLAMLAFLEAGHSDRGDGDAAYYAINLHRGLKYLLAAQDEQGVYGSRSSHDFIYNHCIATKAMCLAYGRIKDPRYRKSAQSAVNWIARARNPGLAWRYEPRGKQNDTSVTAWAVQALGAARTAGLETDPGAFEGARLWVHKMTAFGQVGYQMAGGVPARPKDKSAQFPPQKSQSMTAAGLTIRLICGDPVDAVFRKGLDLISKYPPKWNPDQGTIDMYYWYIGTRLLRHSKLQKSARGRIARRHWDKAVRSAIVRHQHPEGSGARSGSWDPIGVWGEDGGRVYSTALMTLALLPTSR